MNSWVIDLRDNMYTVVKSQVEARFKPVYKNLTVTNEPFSEEKPSFPTVCYTELPAQEIEVDLERDRIDSVRVANQIEVYVLKEDRAEAYKIMNHIINVMKSYSYTASNIADVRYISSDVTRITTRFTRTVGRDDVL